MENLIPKDFLIDCTHYRKHFTKEEISYAYKEMLSGRFSSIQQALKICYKE